MKYLKFILLVVLLAGGIAYMLMDSNSSTVEQVSDSPAVAVGQQARVDFMRDVKPILDSRCVVCHGCYDAPCQVKLTSIEGIQRGASSSEIYAPRILKMQPTRLYEDAFSEAEWRQKGFFPILSDNPQHAGLMQRMLQLKQQHPLPETAIVPASLDLSLTRKQQCTAIKGFDQFAEEHPLSGMPYALPGLDKQQNATLMNWLSNGATNTQTPSLPAEYLEQIKQWESFLNEDALKNQLMSRYLYEHLFFGHLYFEPLPEKYFFKLVRSRTPPGQPIDLIATRRPYDDPGTDRVYYRLSLEKETIIAKSHLPYALNKTRMQKWRNWFLEQDYSLRSLPSYQPETAANPFVTFKDIPVVSRYRFMLDEARFTIMGFIKGPVCRGDRALGVINDQTWIVFIDPENEILKQFGEYIADNTDYLRLPASEGSNTDLLFTWYKYLKLQKSYLKQKQDFLKDAFAGAQALTMDFIWDGDGNNKNAALSIFRHQDSATVIQVLVGEKPKTAWVVSYHLLERIHYLLVAGFDTFGSIGHLLNTRLYMDFIRMEGEANFLSFLPLSKRSIERDHWYRGDEDSAKDYIQGNKFRFDKETGIKFTSEQPKLEFYDLLKQRLNPVLNTTYELDSVPDSTQRKQLQRLAAIKGRAISWLAPVTLLSVLNPADGRPDIYSLVHNDGHKTVSYIWGHDKARLPDEDSLTVVKGFLGDYPNTFMQVDASELSTLVDTIENLNSEQAYAALLDRFGIRRTSLQFWQHSDQLHAAYFQLSPIEAGLLDFNRLENR